MALTIAALGLVAGLCFILVRGQPYDSAMLVRTAVSTSIGLAVATVIAAWFVWRTARSVVPPATLLRVGIALSLVIALGRVLPSPGKLMTIAYAAVLAGGYVVLLVLLRELGRNDLNMIRTVFKRKA